MRRKIQQRARSGNRHFYYSHVRLYYKIHMGLNQKKQCNGKVIKSSANAIIVDYLSKRIKLLRHAL